MDEYLAMLGRGDPTAVLAAAAVLAATLCALLALRWVTAPRPDPVQDRLRRMAAGQATDIGLPTSVAAGKSPRSALELALGPVSKVAMPSDERELGRIRSRLSYAGYRGERAIVFYMAAKVLLALGLGGIAAWIQLIRPQAVPYAAAIVVGAVTIGFYLPSLWLSGRVEERQRALNHSLPDALDLLVTCVEAGLGLEAAMNRVAEEIRLSAPILSDELNQCALEIQAGMSRGDAFRRMANRTGIEELRSLSAIMIQTQMFGTSVALSLRVQSDSMRVRRMQQAEEKAAIVAVKLSFPLVCCILPSLFAVVLGPAIVNIAHVLLPKLAGEQ
jgi:tight adherence protein C